MVSCCVELLAVELVMLLFGEIEIKNREIPQNDQFKYHRIADLGLRASGTWHAFGWHATLACHPGMPPMTTNVENRGGTGGTVITLRIRWFIGK